jgi:ribosomal protein L1
VSFDEKKLEENIDFIISTLFDNRPSGVKGKLIKKLVLSSSM